MATCICKYFKACNLSYYFLFKLGCIIHGRWCKLCFGVHYLPVLVNFRSNDCTHFRKKVEGGHMLPVPQVPMHMHWCHNEVMASLLAMNQLRMALLVSSSL